MDWMAKESGFDSLQAEEIFLLYQASKLALRIPSLAFSGYRKLFA
jgi:hypothetical protein